MLGTITAINGDTITITPQKAGDPTTITIGAGTRVRMQTTIAATDLKAGDRVVALGAQNGDVFQATRIQVTQAQAPQTPTP